MINYNYITIGVEKDDNEYEIPYKNEMTLEDFKNAMEEVIGPCKLNVIPYDKNKNKKMNDIVKKYPNIAILNNENLGHLVKNWKGNFINKYNSCSKDSYIQALVHSLIPKMCEKEEENRKKKGLSISKDFKSY